MSILSYKTQPPFVDNWKRIGLVFGLTGLGVFLATWVKLIPPSDLLLYLSLFFMATGVISFSISHLNRPEGIQNDGMFFGSISSRGIVAWIAALLVTVFYVILYLKAEWLGLGANGSPNSGLVGLFDPLSFLIKGVPASQWFVYGTLYTLSIFFFGIKFISKYRHNRYQVIRTISVMFFQLFFAYLIPEIMEAMNPDTATNYFGKDVKNMWPLDYDFFDKWHLDNLISGGALGNFFLIWGLLMVFVISPILTYIYGKRWYCSWVCGCGGLAETAGDSFRHLSDKSTRAWKIERWSIYSILVFSFVMTIAVIFGYLNDNPDKYMLSKNSFTILSSILLTLCGLTYLFLQRRNTEKSSNTEAYIILGVILGVILILFFNYSIGSGNAFFVSNYSLRKFYGLYIGAVFSGIVGVGFYPLLGSRVWCRFGCPMAALLGIQQKLFSRFRITVNGGQCISCGNCSTYCEMGIDVRSYAQKGQNVVRASCVGCGVCSAVCPRGVLRLENSNADIFSKTNSTNRIVVAEADVKILG